VRHTYHLRTPPAVDHRHPWIAGNSLFAALDHAR
jgi:hypothetical protein